MSRLVWIYFRRAVQALRSLGKLLRAAVEIEQLQESVAVVALAIRGVVKLAQKLQHLRRRPVCARDLLHDGDELAPLSAPPLKLFELARKFDCCVILIRIEKLPDQC